MTNSTFQPKPEETIRETIRETKQVNKNTESATRRVFYDFSISNGSAAESTSLVLQQNLNDGLPKNNKLQSGEFRLDKNDEDCLLGVTKFRERNEEAVWFKGFLSNFVATKGDKKGSQDFISHESFSGCPDSCELRVIPLQLYYIYRKFYQRSNQKAVFWKLEEHCNHDIILTSIFTYWFEKRFETTQKPKGKEDKQFLKDFHLDLKITLLKLGYKREKIISANRMLKGITILLQNHPEKKDLIKKIRTAQGLLLINARLIKIDPFKVLTFHEERQN